jgi:hypothetical protein
MVREALMMVRMSIDAFVNSDAGLAKKVIQYDTSVDNNNRMVISELKELMKTDTSLVEPALHCFSASRHIERIADHAENIAEEVVYLVDGDIVRHKHGNFSLGKYSKQDAETKLLKVKGDLQLKAEELSLKARESAAKTGEDPAMAAMRLQQEIAQAQELHGLEMAAKQMELQQAQAQQQQAMQQQQAQVQQKMAHGGQVHSQKLEHAEMDRLEKLLQGNRE